MVLQATNAGTVALPHLFARLAADTPCWSAGVAWEQRLPPPWFTGLAQPRHIASPKLPGRDPHPNAATAAIPRRRRYRGTARAVAAISISTTVFVVTMRSDYAQSLDQYFPTGLSGFNDQFTTVTSRPRSEYDPLGVREGGFTIAPEVTESLGFDSNPSANPRPHAAGISDTEASVTANSNWSRNSLGVFAAVDSANYVGQSQQSHTDWRLVGTGQLDFGEDHANATASHLDLHQTADELSSLATQQPVHYSVNDLRTSYLAKLGNLSLLPSVDFTSYQFDNVLLAGLNSNQGFRSRDVLQGGVTASYAFAPGKNGVLAGNVVKVDYTSNPVGQASRNSTGGSILAGLDFSESDLFRYRILGGFQLRSFASPVYKARSAPIIQADVVWTATTLTTVTGRVSRSIEDAADESLIGYTDTQAQLTVDHEYARNVLLQGRLAVDHAEYLQNGGEATLYSTGASISYLFNRNMRVTLSSDVQARTGSASFVRDITLLRVQAQI